MNNLINKIVDGLSSLRSTLSACLTLLVAFAGIYVTPSKDGNNYSASHDKTFGLPFGLINIEHLENNFAVGAHLISPRSFYMHHGIHLGGGKIAHYSGFSSSFRAGPIEITDLESFANGKPVWACQESREYSAAEIVRRARSRVGESQYRVLSNNCEHFCSWCINGESYSAQINAYLHSPRGLLSFISSLDPRFIA
ncbi:lecithin retinol acyltransferase family protein [Pseudomonas migulae]|uniref:lecithin retinol acyltransferase family protein n=1 Tax=Pseudomonas migulae TaxID=78543 RepID=UPI00371E5630